MTCSHNLDWTEVFVYGTLLQEQSNHLYLASGIRVGTDTLMGFWMFDLGSYPMIVAAADLPQPTRSQLPPTQGIIIGELYRIPVSLLPQLDDLEDHPREYRRQWVRLGSGSQAWVYVGRADLIKGSEAILSGDWRQRFLSHQSLL